MKHPTILFCILALLVCQTNFAQKTSSCEDKKAFMGINFDEISDEKAQTLGFDNEHGVYITSVISNTAAQTSGIKAFDYIYGIDEYRTGASQKLAQILSNYRAGQKAEVHLIRNGEKISKSITFGERGGSGQSFSYQDQGRAFLGIKNMRKSVDVDGVQVAIVDNSTAEAMQMQDRDIIQSINGNRILDWSDIKTAINDIKVGQAIEVAIYRDGSTMKLKGKMGSTNYKNKSNSSIYKGVLIYSIQAEYDYDADEWESSEDFNWQNLSVSVEAMPGSEIEDFNNRYNQAIPSTNNLEPSSISVLPDPTQQVFILRFNLSNAANTTVRVYNSMGRVIYDNQMNNFSGQFKDTVDLSQNGFGKYMLHIQQGDKAFIKSINLNQA